MFSGSRSQEGNHFQLTCNKKTNSRVEDSKSFRREVLQQKSVLVGGFNPSEKHWSNLIISPKSSDNQKKLKPPPSVVT